MSDFQRGVNLAHHSTSTMKNGDEKTTDPIGALEQKVICMLLFMTEIKLFRSQHPLDVTLCLLDWCAFLSV